MAVTQHTYKEGKKVVKEWYSDVTGQTYPSQKAAEDAEANANKGSKLKNAFNQAGKNNANATSEDINNTIKSLNKNTEKTDKAKKEADAKKISALENKLSLLYERKAQSDLSNEDYAAIDTQINKLKAEIESLKTGTEVPPEKINPQLYNNGQIQHGVANKADELIEKYYNSKDGTFAKLYDALKAEGANDDTIAKIIVDKGLNGAKAQEWLNKYNKDYDDNAKALGEVEFEKNQPVTKEALDAAKHQEYEDFKDDANKKVDDLANSESEIDPKLPEGKGTDTTNPPGKGKTDSTTGTGGKGDGEGETDLDKFWKAFKAGAFRAYPMLQAIGDALSQQAKMTMDRANILTGKGSDLSVYEGKDPSEYFFNEDYEYRQAFLDAENGNYEGVKELLLKGKVTLDQVAAALKLTEEDVEKIFGQEIRGREADTVSKELANEKVLKDEIKDLHAQLTSVNECIHDLEGSDRDYYLDVLAKFMSIYEGRETVGTQNGTTTTENDTAGGTASVNGGVPVINASGSVTGSHAEGTTESRTASRNKDISAIKALPKGEEYAQMALEDRDKANDELMNNLLALKQTLLDQIAEAELQLKTIRTNQNAAQTGGKNTIVIPSSKDMSTTPTDTTTTTDASGGNGNATEQQQ